jgi:hypothetical protein
MRLLRPLYPLHAPGRSIVWSFPAGRHRCFSVWIQGSTHMFVVDELMFSVSLAAPSFKPSSIMSGTLPIRDS